MGSKLCYDIFPTIYDQNLYLSLLFLLTNALFLPDESVISILESMIVAPEFIKNRSAEVSGSYFEYSSSKSSFPPLSSGTNLNRGLLFPVPVLVSPIVEVTGLGLLTKGQAIQRMFFCKYHKSTLYHQQKDFSSDR